MPTALTPLPRPRLYDELNEHRSRHYIARYAMLRNDRYFDEVLEDWITISAGPESADLWGMPDKSLNPMAHTTRQLVTPGLYGKRPLVRGPGPLVEPHGPMASYWPRMQAIQYYTVGLGVFLQQVHVDRRGRLVWRPVEPHNVVAWVDPADPMNPVGLWELRLRQWWQPGKDGELELRRAYAWDMWDISDPDRPSFRIAETNESGQPGKDITGRFLTDPITGGATEGDGYRWRNPDPGEDQGAPFMPFVWYHAVDDGDVWPMWRRSMHEGTLRACTYWTYTGRAALHSTGEHTLIGGVDPDGIPGAELKRGDGSQEAGSVPLFTMRISPQSMTFLPLVEGQNLQSISIGAGVNLPNLGAFANQYQMLLATGDGLMPTDATRRSANPTSGSALEINARNRREFSDQVEPLFEASDLRALQVGAWVRTIQGWPTPSDGYSIEYHTIPLTPTEQKDARDQTEWEEDRGLLSPVDAYIRMNPGADRDQARRAVIAARVEAAEIEAEVKAEVAKIGAGEPPAQQDLGTAGARATAILAIVQRVASGGITQEAGVALLGELFGMDADTAATVLDGAQDKTPQIPSGPPPGDGGDEDPPGDGGDEDDNEDPPGDGGEEEG